MNNSNPMYDVKKELLLTEEDIQILRAIKQQDDLYKYLKNNPKKNTETLNRVVKIMQKNKS